MAPEHECGDPDPEGRDQATDAQCDRVAGGGGDRRPRRLGAHPEQGDEPVVERMETDGEEERHRARQGHGPPASPRGQPDHGTGESGDEDVGDLRGRPHQGQLEVQPDVPGPRLPLDALDRTGGATTHQHQVEARQRVGEPRGAEHQQGEGDEEFGALLDGTRRPQGGRDAVPVVDDRLEHEGEPETDEAAAHPDGGQSSQVGQATDGQVARHDPDRADQEGDVAGRREPRPHRVAGHTAGHRRWDDQDLPGDDPPHPGLTQEGERLRWSGEYGCGRRVVGAARPGRPVPFGQGRHRSEAVPAGRVRHDVGQSATSDEAMIRVGRSRTRSSPGTPLRLP